MRRSTTKIETGRTRMRTGITPTATIRVQRATDTGGRSKPSNSNTTTSTSTTSTSTTTNARISRRRVTQYSSTDVPPIPPRTRQTNGGGINLSRSQGSHTFANAGASQTRSHQTSNQSLSLTTPQLSQTQSRVHINTNSTNNTTSQGQRIQNRNRTNTNTNSTQTNRNSDEGRLFPRAPPPAEAARRNLHRSARNSETTTSTNRLTNTNTASRTTGEESSSRTPIYARPNPQLRASISPRNAPTRESSRSSAPTGEPIIPNVQHHLLETPNRPAAHHPSPSDNVGSTQEPQVLLRSSANLNTNRATNSTTNRSTSNNLNTQSNTTNTRSLNNSPISLNQPTSDTNTNRSQPQIRTPSSNNDQQRSIRPNLTNTGTRTTPSTNPNNPRNSRQDPITLAEDGHISLFDELFSILDNFPINVVPLIPMMFESSFGPFLESVIPLYLAHYERNQIIRAIDESMLEAANPRPEPPKKVKLINHVINEEDTKNGRECLICLSDFQAGEQTVMLKCGHFFHKDCLMPWFVEHHTCPTCRENIDEADLQK